MDDDNPTEKNKKSASTDYSHYWLTPEKIEALRQDSIEASRYFEGKFSKFLEEKLGYKKEQ